MRNFLTFVVLVLSNLSFGQNVLNASLDNQPIVDKFTITESNKMNPSIMLFQPSPNSFWAGATLGYNFEREGTDNIIGAGQVKLETVKKFQENPFFDLLIVGNLAKVTSSLSEDSSDDISEIVQSNQGLYFGVSPIWVINKKGIKKEEERRSKLQKEDKEYGNQDFDIWRLYFNGGYKLNGFQDVGPDKETINLSQIRISTGIEFEGLHVSSGAPIHLSSELIFTSFSKNEYSKVFNEEKSKLIAWENTVILPIGKDIGVMAKYTLANIDANVLQVGIVLRNLSSD